MMLPFLTYTILDRCVDMFFDSLDLVFNPIDASSFFPGQIIRCLSRRSSFQCKHDPSITVIFDSNFYDATVIAVDTTTITISPRMIETVNIFPSPMAAAMEYPREMIVGNNLVRDQMGVGRIESYQLIRSGCEVKTTRIPMSRDNPPYVIELYGVTKAW